jgi:hypothetical protein
MMLQEFRDAAFAEAAKVAAELGPRFELAEERQAAFETACDQSFAVAVEGVRMEIKAEIQAVRDEVDLARQHRLDIEKGITETTARLAALCAVCELEEDKLDQLAATAQADSNHQALLDDLLESARFRLHLPEDEDEIFGAEAEAGALPPASGGDVQRPASPDLARRGSFQGTGGLMRRGSFQGTGGLMVTANMLEEIEKNITMPEDRSEDVDDLLLQVNLIKNAMTEKADNEHVIHIQDTISRAEAMLETCMAEMRTKLDAAQVTDLKCEVGTKLADMSRGILEMKKVQADLAGSEEVNNLREDAARSRMEVATCQKMMKEKVGAGQVQVLVDALKTVRMQITVLERGIAQKAELDIASRHEATLADLQMKVAGLAAGGGMRHKKGRARRNSEDWSTSEEGEVELSLPLVTSHGGQGGIVKDDLSPKGAVVSKPPKKSGSAQARRASRRQSAEQ